ncbi:MAG TPA: hypothetical protein DDY52_02910 [Candidatus Moranbacteria bacterium]|nr:MAG: hypothetical protein UR51_C0002G0081 [Candidatus Moranbacteria bacterium GW2011_GWF1_34_10]HBI17074.1 hypothetical protein [Candidatus Moranbacteria bacterium]
MKEKNFELLILPSVPNIKQVVEKLPLDIKFTKGMFKNLEIIFANNEIKITHKGIDLKNFSFIWLCSAWSSRDLAYAVNLFLQRNNIPSTEVEKGTSKLTDQMLFSLNNIPTPNTLFLGSKSIGKFISQIGDTCGYPLIIKDIRGSRGTNSVKVSNAEELVEEMAKLPKHKKYIFQKYIENEYDWGIMVANGIVVSGEKSYSCQGEFRNNACNGATETFVELSEIPENIKQIALDSSRAVGLSWSRTDIIIDKNNQQPFVLEINRLPGISSRTSEVEGAYKFLSSEIAYLCKR